ncbi:uncharacterized protein [Watersipora subatra]|uniref:uncharacterized protein n=1 Tax=Watersipora subatra TaxID=2589382 RepID=UPI00355B6C5F
MVYSTRTRSMQTRSSKPLNSGNNGARTLRKRRLSLRYAEDDGLPKVPEKFMREDVKEGNTLNSYMKSPSGKKSLRAKNICPSPSKNQEKFRTTNEIAVDMRCSDGDSVASCDSFDSGMGSRSDEERLALPPSPEKHQAKPITIEIMSPATNVVNVIEVFEENDQEFVGYVRASPDSGYTVDPTNCANCNLMKRSRMARSISTNVSEDSNDSAFQGFKPISRDDTPEITKPNLLISNKPLPAKTCKIKKIMKKDKLNKKISMKSTRLSKTGKLSTKKTSKKRPSTKHLRRSRHPMPCSPRKRALLRIQHHNRSPERPVECATPAVVARNCRTRSHIKSLLKDITTPTSGQLTLSASRQKPSSINKPCPLTYITTNLGVDNTVEKPKFYNSTPKFRPESNGSEVDSGTASDDQQTLPASACQWRFCKAEVSPADLSEHIDKLHVAPQKRNSKMYKCFWDGCKVYGQVAKSIIWLEGHVKKHLGSRPYHCIFPDCASSFPSQELLLRHVDTHIEPVELAKAVKKAEPSLSKKSEKKKIKRMRGTEKCIPKRTDFFTSSIVEAGRWENKVLQDNLLHLLSEDRASLKLQGQIVAMTTVGDDEMVQFHWFPEELQLADSWHKRTDPVSVSRVKEVKISNLDRDTYINLLQSANC